MGCDAMTWSRGMRVETTEPLKQGEWQQIAVTYDGGMKAAGVRIWVDGRPQKINVLFDSLLWPIDNKEPWRIGAGGGVRAPGSDSSRRSRCRRSGALRGRPPRAPRSTPALAS